MDSRCPIVIRVITFASFGYLLSKMQASTNKLTHAVFAWETKGDEVFSNELIEAISLDKLIVNGKLNVGTEVCMQFKKELWCGSSLSLHGK